jgi:hypothetical protein
LAALFVGGRILAAPILFAVEEITTTRLVIPGHSLQYSIDSVAVELLQPGLSPGKSVRTKAPVSHLTVDYGEIRDDITARYGFLEIMVYGQATLGETTLAVNKLESLIERLRHYISLD